MISPEEFQRIRSEARARSLNRIVAPEEASKWWWLSFADGSRPDGGQFLGATVVAGDDLAEATITTHLLGINPGGDIKGVAFGPREIAVMGQKNFDFMLNHLRSREEIIATGMALD